jgi:outer membrane receptor protein involved in Fe transport
MTSLKTLSGALLATTMLMSPSAFARQTAGDIASDSSDEPIEQIEVRGQFIPDAQRRTAQVASFVTSADLDRSGDANAAIALTRVSGLSVVGGRFAYVRGLGDRYAAATLNGSPLPSPEPLRRIVPLDLFPAEVLDGAAVQKTYSVNYPGEFGGGVIDLTTLRQPAEPFFNLRASVGYNTVTTGEQGVFHRGTTGDWSSFSGPARNIPRPIQAVIDSQTRLGELTPAQLEEAGESLVRPNLLLVQSGELGPDFSASADAGFGFNHRGFDIGLVGAIGYDTGWTIEDSIRQRVRGDVMGSDLRTQVGALDTTVNALGTLSVGYDDHQVQFTAFYVNSGRKDTQVTRGDEFNAPGGRPIHEEFTGWFERELAMFQASGRHGFGDLEVRWRGSVAQASRDTPFLQRLLRYEDADGVPIYSFSNRYSIEFTELTDDLTSFGGELAYTFMLPGQRELVLTAGGDTARTERDFRSLFFRLGGGSGLPDDVRRARPDFLFSPANIGPNRFVLTETQTPQSNYEGRLDVDAAFVQADVDVIPYIRATVGARYEDAVQQVQTFSRFGQLGRGARLENDYILPAATVTWNFASDLQLRLGYSETIARPQFREFANSGFFDPETQRSYRGFDGLVDSRLTNYDARLEYYLGRDQFITGALFHKEIENPIEEVQFETASFVTETTFFNSPKAELTGVELEYRQMFQFPLDVPWFRDQDWRFAVNYTYTKSEVIAPAGTLVLDPITDTWRDAAFFNLDGSQLQGTPENIVNAQFGWEGERDQFTILVNWLDERILQRGFDSPSGVLPDVIEEPGVQLDMVYRRSFQVMDREFRIGLSGRNLLDERHREFQRNETLGATDFNTYDRGRSFSVSLTAAF